MIKNIFICFFFLLSVFFISTTTSVAGNWNVKTSIKQEASYHSNHQMLIHNAKEIYGSITTPTITIENKTPTSSISLKNTIVQNLFNETEFNSTDFYNNNTLSRRTERWEATLNAGFNYNTTRSSEITTFGTETKNDRHIGYNLSPVITYTPSVKNSFTLSTGFNASRYENSARNTDYNIYSSNFSWGHALSQFSTSYLSLNARRYETQNNNDETVDSIGPSVGWRMILSEKLTTILTVGAEASRQKSSLSNTKKKWLWNNVFSGKLIYKNEQHNLSVTISRQQQPYSNASSSLLTDISFSEEYKFNNLLTGNIGSKYQRAKASSLSSSNLKSRWTANTGIKYSLTKKMNLGAYYKYKEEKLTNTNGKQTDNSFLLRFTYNPTF